MAHEEVELRVDICRQQEQHLVTLSAQRIFGQAAVGSRFDVQSPQWVECARRFQAQATNDSFFRAAGQELFGLLFPDGHRLTYELNNQYVIEDRLSRVLRVQLRLLDEELFALPWECLYDAAGKLWLGANPYGALSRYVDAPVPPPLPIKPPLRLMIATAEPTDMPAVHAEQELGAIHEAMKGLLAEGLVSARVVQHANRRSLRRGIETIRPHMFHFIGHGRRAGSASSLILETPDKRQDAMTMEIVLEFLQQSQDLRAVVLNACESGHGAMMLAKAGLAAVGMQEKIRTEAAIPFCSTFYRAMAESVPLDVACNKARANVRMECGGDRRDWCLPAVFLPGGRGALFQITLAGRSQAAMPAAQVVRPPMPGPTIAGPAGTRDGAATGVEEADLVAPGETGSFISRRLLVVLAGIAGVAAVVVLAASLIGRYWPSGGARTTSPAVAVPPPVELVTVPPGQAVFGYPDTGVTVRLLAQFWTDSKPADVPDPFAVYTNAVNWQEMKAQAMLNLLLARPREVSLPSFFIDKAEVTNAEYRRFLAEVKVKGDAQLRHPLLTGPKDYTPWTQTWSAPRFNEPNQPVVGVDWFDACAYARWAGKRLPSQDEWELAARGPQRLLYPWGDSFDPTRCNTVQATTRGPTPAGYFEGDRSPCGALDMGGNVMEWTASETLRGRLAVVRGAAWNGVPGPVFSLTFFPWAKPRDVRTDVIGFRCVRDAQAGQAVPPGMLLVKGEKLLLGGEVNPLLEMLRKFPPHIPPIQKSFFDNEGCKPQQVQMHGFRICRNEVTCAEYRRFLAAVRTSGDQAFRHPNQPAGKDHTPARWSDDAAGDDKPVVGVDFWDAHAYSRWAGGRLPTVQEWEYAARGNSARIFPWGDSLEPGKCNCAEARQKGPTPAGTFAEDRSPFGVMDMGGNVKEWTATDWPQSAGKARILKGGAWNEPVAPESAAYLRHCAGGVSLRDEAVGFRWVQDLPPGGGEAK